MTETTKKATTATATRKTTATRTRKTATAKKAETTETIVFENVKQLSEYYNITAKNVRRLLRQHFARTADMKNAVYKFDKKQSDELKAFFDERYKNDTK